MKPHPAAGHESFDGCSTTLSPKGIPSPNAIPSNGDSPQQESMLKEIAECTGLSLAQVKKLQASMA